MSVETNLSRETKLTRVMNAVAAGTTNQNSSSVDMQGFDTVLFMALFGTILATAVTSIKAQQSSDDGVADAFSDLAGTLVVVADTDDNKAVYLEIAHPQKRYVRLVVSRGTANATIDGVLAQQGDAKQMPTTHDSATVLGEFHAAPDEGTA